MGVFATGDGVIISLRNDVPDNRYENGSLVYSETFESSSADDTSTGNYLLIDHQNGEYSLLCHFLERSIVPSIGDRVQQGDFIGKIGMSGDTSYPHFHYQLQNSLETSFTTNGKSLVLFDHPFNIHICSLSTRTFVLTC